MSASLPAVRTRYGHFRLESGLHAREWLDLETLFLDPIVLAPHVKVLAELLQSYDVSAVCGPLTGGAFVAQAVAAEMSVRFYFTEPHAGYSAEAIFAATYRLPPALRNTASRERFAVVDDVISAGSSVRATVSSLVDAGASVAVVGALVVLGDRAVLHFREHRIPLVADSFRPFESWEPAVCPLCRAHVALVLP